MIFHFKMFKYTKMDEKFKAQLKELIKSDHVNSLLVNASTEIKDFILIQLKAVTLLLEENERLTERIKELEKKLALDSHNSSKPPSTDGFKKRYPEKRKSTGEKPGGQNGHEGHTLKFAENPDVVLDHPVNQCNHCGHDLSNTPVNSVERKQVIDIPKLRTIVTEHRGEIKICPHCGETSKGEIPNTLKGPVEYGDGIKSLFVYLNEYQLIPYDRIVELFKDIFSQFPSAASIYNANELCYEQLENVEDQIKNEISHSEVVHFDETGIRVTVNSENKSLHWLHVSSTEEFTYYHIDPKRGKEAMDRMEILPSFTGVAVHDGYQSYMKFENCEHSLCNSHYLRDLTFVHEEEGYDWGLEMKELLLEINKTVDQAKEEGKTSLENNIEKEFNERYTQILQTELTKRPPPEESVRKKGGKKRSKGENLLDRMLKYENEILRFMRDFRVPFTNNRGERDIRMTKLKQKISGCFRSEKGGKMFCRIRGYISTVKKQGLNVLEAISQALNGQPTTFSFNKPA